MPTYRLSSQVRGRIELAVAATVQNQCAIVQADFPLSVLDVQNAILSRDQIDMMTELARTGVTGLPLNRMFNVYVAQNALPDISRDCVLRLVLPTQVYTDGTLDWLVNAWDVNNFSGKVMRLSVAHLDTETKTALTHWINSAIRARRQQCFVDRTVHKYLSDFSTTSHLTAGWPLMTQFVHDHTWRQKFANPPRDLSSYQRSLSAETRKRMDTADTIILGARMYPEFKEDKTRPQAVVSAWRPRANDPELI